MNECDAMRQDDGLGSLLNRNSSDIFISLKIKTVSPKHHLLLHLYISRKHSEFPQSVCWSSAIRACFHSLWQYCEMNTVSLIVRSYEMNDIIFSSFNLFWCPHIIYENVYNKETNKKLNIKQKYNTKQKRK